MKFKDKCDNCGRFDYLKSTDDGRCLCPKCLDKLKKEKKKGK